MVRTFKIAANWQLIFHELGLNPYPLLRMAGLDSDILERQNVKVSEKDYFRLFDVLQEEMTDQPLALTMCNTISIEALSPVVMLAICSYDLNTAATRLSQFRKLFTPLTMTVNVGPQETVLELHRAGVNEPPPTYSMVQLAFLLQLARRCTKTDLVPVRVTIMESTGWESDYEDFFGVRLRRDSSYSIAFSAAYGTRPFLTANDSMWRYFAPYLSQRLAETEVHSSMKERLFNLLYEQLPEGFVSQKKICSLLKISARSLQRQLAEEKTTYNQVLNQTREQLARHYLANSTMELTEIAYLLGYEDHTSFFRAFRKWTGQTPSSYRTSLS